MTDMGYSRREKKAPGPNSSHSSILTGALLLIAVCLILAILDSVTGTDSFRDILIRPWFLH